MGYSLSQPHLLHRHWLIHGPSEIVPKAKGMHLYLLTEAAGERHRDALPVVYTELLDAPVSGAFPLRDLAPLLTRRDYQGIVYCGVSREAIDEVNARNIEDIAEGVLSRVSMIAHARAVFLGDLFIDTICA